jgi:hypothetical protein
MDLSSSENKAQIVYFNSHMAGVHCHSQGPRAQGDGRFYAAASISSSRNPISSS